MKARYMLFALALAPVTAAAQEPPPRVVERWRTAEPQGRLDAQAWVYNRRSRIGVTVNTRADSTDVIGARIEGVTPGGPAAKAGLRTGDIITKFNGTSLVGSRDRMNDEGTSFPGIRLIELAAKVGPGDTVAVEYRRGKDRRNARLVTVEEPGNVVFRRTPDGNGYVFGEPNIIERRVLPKMGEGNLALTTPGFEVFFGSSLFDLELAPLNEDLGQYFGTSEGVLVIRTPRRGELGLKGGDVITAVDGRKASNPSQLMRILRSYDRDESVKFEILRNRKRETVTGKLDQATGERRPVSELYRN